ncbi:ABC transporter substrate-binding protein [Chromobacterium phragmitis]|uniref:ABC transporter substrate-binding protein n=1 Tax=Chromobacterium phragmitis TaxID=2202141 RepID=UPI000DEC8FED|nr:ABC transporter substrate-binding protein [Chromobacterium phragmitis]AXE31415.1 ABC transporter substrate-binding protein [Chromobacterium phragmitis]
MNRHSRRTILWLGFASLLATPLSFSAPAPALEKRDITMAVGGIGVLYYLPFAIAERRGYFRDEGLNVKIVDFPGGAKALQALVGGSADLVSGSFEHVLQMQAKGQPIQSIVTQGEIPGLALMVPRDKAASWRSPADLKGLKVGVSAPGSGTHLFLNALLAKANLKPDAVSAIGVGTGATAIAALESGQIDALVSVDPSLSVLERNGTGVAVVDTRKLSDTKAVYGGSYAAGSIYAKTDFIQKNPKTAQAVANAMVRALAWLKQATPQQIVAAVPPSFYGKNPAIYQQALVKSMPSYTADGVMTAEAARNVYQSLLASNPALRRVQPEHSYDNRFALKAAKQIAKP